jgi:hypothetical protein
VADSAQTAVFTSSTADDVVPAEARKAYAEAAMERYLSAYEYTLVSERSVSYGGLQGTETIAEFDGAPRRVRTFSNANVTRVRKGKAYQVLLFDGDDGKIFVFSGLAVYDADSYVSQFARILSTFAKGG